MTDAETPSDDVTGLSDTPAEVDFGGNPSPDAMADVAARIDIGGGNESAVPVDAAGSDVVGDGTLEDAASDGEPEDVMAAPCAEEYISVRFQFAGEPVQSVCAAIYRFTVSYVIDCVPGTCTPFETSANADRMDLGIDRLYVGEAGEPFGSVGTRPLSVFLHGVSPLCPAGEQQCSYHNTSYEDAGPRCSFVVTRAGSIGDVVEAHLAAPCTLWKWRPTSSSRSQLEVLELAVHGRLEPPGSVPCRCTDCRATWADCVRDGG